MSTVHDRTDKVWDNPAIILFHGTLRVHAQAIAGGGVELSFGRSRTDFGRGFYTTTSRRQAEVWSLDRSDRSSSRASALLRLSVDREALASLTSIAFSRAPRNAEDYWRFIAHCRDGMPHLPGDGGYYDVAYGPVARAWPGAGNSRIFAGSDQISFHTRRAQDLLNDRTICQIEVL